MALPSRMCARPHSTSAPHGGASWPSSHSFRRVPQKRSETVRPRHLLIRIPEQIVANFGHERCEAPLLGMALEGMEHPVGRTVWLVHPDNQAAVASKAGLHLTCQSGVLCEDQPDMP